MPWFRNHYVCTACEGHWLAEAAEAEAADCPHCRSFDVAPYRSEDFSRVIERDGTRFVVMECTKVKTRGADWRAVKRFATREEAKAFLATL
ncbi:MAG: hypothetical protein JSR61_21630 [Proteobacteria bacterium]|nr:hypothetical protein [Pseudomonadota bacterium]